MNKNNNKNKTWKKKPLIFCINLEHRTDRKESSLKEFSKLGFDKNDIHYYPNLKKDPRGGVFGCFESHMLIWDYFFYNFPEHKHCVIFEDDFVCTNSHKNIRQLKKACKFIDNNTGVDILFLHKNCVNETHKNNTKLFTKGYGLCSHAYIISKKYIETIIRKYGSLPKANGNNVDLYISTNHFDKSNWLYTKKVFFTKQDCFYQLVDKSDNINNVSDQFLRIDINKTVLITITILKNIKKYEFLNDSQIKKMLCIIESIRNNTPSSNLSDILA